MKRTLAFAMLAIMAVLAVGTVSATSDEDSIIIPSAPGAPAYQDPFPSSAAEPSIIVEELPLNLGPDQELIGRLREAPEDEQANWITPGIYPSEGDSEQGYPPIRPVGPERADEPSIRPVGPERREPPIRPVGPERTDPHIRPVGPEREEPHIRPIGPEKPDPDIRPVGPERPDPDIQPVGPEKEEPRIRPVGPERPDHHIHPIGPERPDHDIHPIGPETEEPHIRPVGPERPDPDIQPIGPERPDPDIRPVGPEKPDPDIRPIGPEVPDIHPIGPETPMETEIVPVGPEEGVHNELEVDLAQLQREAKQVRTRLLGGLHDILASLFSPEPAASAPSAEAATDPSEAEVRSEPFEGGVLTTSTQRLPDGGVVMVREFRAGGPLIEQKPEELPEEGEEAQQWDDDDEVASFGEEDNEDAEDADEPLHGSLMPRFFSPFHGFFRRFFHGAPPHPFLRRGMFEQDDDAFPHLKQQEHIRHAHGHGRRGCKKRMHHGEQHPRSPLFERLRHMLDSPLVPPPPPAHFELMDGPRHAHRHHGHRHRFGHRHERPRLQPVPDFDEQDEAEFEGWPDTPSVETTHMDWPTQAEQSEQASLEESLEEHHSLLGDAHDSPHHHRRRRSWFRRNRAWLLGVGGAVLLLSLLALAVCVHRARARKRALAHAGAPMVLFSPPHSHHFERLSSDASQQPVPEHEINTPYARMSEQQLPNAQMQMAAPLLPNA